MKWIRTTALEVLRLLIEDENLATTIVVWLVLFAVLAAALNLRLGAAFFAWEVKN